MNQGSHLRGPKPINPAQHPLLIPLHGWPITLSPVTAWEHWCVRLLLSVTDLVGSSIRFVSLGTNSRTYRRVHSLLHT